MFDYDAAVLALKGIQASFDMGLASKLMWRYSLDMWDFNADIPGFFVNYLSIMGLYAALTHYALEWLQARRRQTSVPSDPVDRCFVRHRAGDDLRKAHG